MFYSKLIHCHRQQQRLTHHFFVEKNLYRARFYIVELDQGSFPDELTSVIDDGGGGNDDGDDNNYNDEGDDSDDNDDGPTDQPTNVQLAFPKI